MSQKQLLKSIREKELQNIIKLYNKGLSQKKIGLIYNISQATVGNLLRENNIKCRTEIENRKQLFTIDDTFFEKIDTEEKAYFLGFLYADGCNYKSGFQISLQERDKYILNKFNELLKSDRTLKFKPQKTTTHQNQYMLRVKNRKMADDLTKLGCVPAKSLILQFPTEEQVPRHLLNHFVRGYFDGDGTIYQQRSSCSYRVSLCGTEIFGIQYGKEIKKILDIFVFIVHKKNNKCKEMVVSGGIQIITLLDWMYKDANYFLTRKYKLYQELKNYLENRRKPKSSKYKGVSFEKNTGKYLAYYCKNAKTYRIGRFDNENDAAQAVIEKLKEINV